MIDTKLLLNSINTQGTNPYVSKHLKWKVGVKLEVSRISPDNNELNEIIEDVRNRELAYLQSVASDNNGLLDFLMDPRINPNPKLAPKKELNDKDKLNFTVACLPPKSENPLKNLSLEPDLAEIALLNHFECLARIITENYGINTKFTILHEVDAYGDLLSVSGKTRRKFLKKLKFYLRNFDADFISVVNWQTRLSKIDGFKEVKRNELIKLEKQLKSEDQKTLTELLHIFPTIYMSIKPDSSGDSELIYLDFQKNKENPKVKVHVKKSLLAAKRIMSFNRARKTVKERQVLFSDFLKGNLTPSKGSWVFWGIGDWNKLYPHHGVGVLDVTTNRISVNYKINLKYTQSSARNVLA